MKLFLRDMSVSSMIAGFVAVMIGFASSAVIVYQAALTAGASHDQISSWFLILGIASAVSTIGLSVYYKMPILTAWSTPGAALLATTVTHLSLPQYLGGFLFAASLTFILAITGLFARLMHLIPKSLAAAMLAGIILHFCMNAFAAMQAQFSLVFSMFLLYLLGKRYFSRYVILAVLLFGILIAKLEGLLHLNDIHFQLSTLHAVWPSFSWSAILSIGLPLFIVTLTSQNIPGLTVMRAAGYEPPVSKMMSIVSFINLLIVPFGGFSMNLAAITAGICLSPEAEADPAKRYTSAVFAGLVYLIQGIFAATLVALFATFPQELTFALAGLALLGTLGNSLQTAISDEKQREPALIAFLVAASGISLFGISSAMWALVAGLISMWIFHGNFEIKLVNTNTQV